MEYISESTQRGLGEKATHMQKYKPQKQAQSFTRHKGQTFISLSTVFSMQVCRQSSHQGSNWRCTCQKQKSKFTKEHKGETIISLSTVFSMQFCRQSRQRVDNH